MEELTIEFVVAAKKITNRIFLLQTVKIIFLTLFILIYTR